MPRTVKDEIMLETIKDWVSVTGFSDDDILKWTVRELREKLREAQGETTAYWRHFLRKLKRNLEDKWWELAQKGGFSISEVNVMQWPEALQNPNSTAAESELDDVADQISIEIR
jgi:hypothetical protein